MKTLLTFLFFLWASVAWAQDMPRELVGQQITIIVPYAPGGGSDQFSRILATKVRANTGLNLVVVNKPGASATIGTREASQAEATGLTLLGSDNAGVVMNPLMKPEGWVPRDRFTAIVITAITPQGIYVAQTSPHRTLGDILALKSPRYGCAYSMCNLFIERILGDRDAVAVPYKSTPQVQIDLSSGQLDFIGISSFDAMAMTQAGRIRPIAFGSEQRLEIYPQAGLFKDLVPDFTATNFHGVYAPKGTPRHIIEYLNRVYREALRDPEVREQFRARAVQTWDGSSEQAERYVDRQISIWRPVVERYYKP